MTERIDIWELPAYRTVLPNGFTVVTMPDESGLVSAMVRIGAGEWHHPTAGTAHLLEHVISTGNSGMEHERLSHLAEQSSYTFARTGWYNTEYGCTNNFANDLPELLEALLKMVYKDSFSKDKTERERLAVQREKQESDPPHKLRLQAFDYTIYCVDERVKSGPRGGTTESVATISHEQLCEFRDTWYTANNSVLVVCGSAVHEHVVEAALRLTEGVPSGIRGIKPMFSEVRPGNFTFTDERTKSGLWVYGSRPNNPHVHDFPFRVLSGYLQSMNGPLSTELRIRQNMIYCLSVKSMFDILSTFELTIPCEEKNLDNVTRVTRETLETLQAETSGLNAWLRRWKIQYSKELLDERINRCARVHMAEIGNRWRYDDWTDNDREHKVTSITLETLHEVAKQWFSPDKLAWIRVVNN